MNLVVVGLSHHRSPVVARERVALDRDAAAETARRLADEGAEAVCLSTCNRTELYAVHADPTVAAALAGRPFREHELPGGVFRLRDAAAARHLFRVAAGLDSLVIGEAEILGQVRTAYDVGSPGRVLDRLFQQALRTGKKVRARTAIAERPASASAAAAALAHQVLGSLEGRRILLIGAGKVCELASRNLITRGGRVAVVANRTLDRAASLARAFDAEVLPLERIGDELRRADVVISSTGAPGFVVDKKQVAAALSARRGRPLLLIDLAVPRDLDPEIRGLRGCFLHDIDDLEEIVALTLAGRRCEAERAEAIVNAEADRFAAWQASLEVVPAITSLRARADAIRAAVLARHERRLSSLTASERRAVETATVSIVNTLLHLPTIRMKEAAVTEEGGFFAHAVQHLFGLAEAEA
jgi:glutamyl-tRNA reductase